MEHAPSGAVFVKGQTFLWNETQQLSFFFFFFYRSSGLNYLFFVPVEHALGSIVNRRVRWSIFVDRYTAVLQQSNVRK